MLNVKLFIWSFRCWFLRRCFDRLVSSFRIIIIIVIIIVIIVVVIIVVIVIILIITAPPSPSVVFNTNHFVNPLRYPASFKKLPYSLWSVAKAFLSHARQPKVTFSLPRTQARSSGFKGYSSDFGSALGIMGKAKRCFSRSPFPASFAWTLCVLMVHCVILIDRSQKSRFSFSKHLRRQGTRQSFSRFQYALTQPNLNCSKIWSKELPRNARSLLRVDVRCSKASLLDHGPVTNFAWTFYG